MSGAASSYEVLTVGPRFSGVSQGSETLARVVIHRSPSPEPPRWDLILLVFHTCYAFVALAAIWVALGRRWFAPRAILLVLAVGAGAIAVEAAFCALTGAPSFDVLSDFLFHALWLVGSLWLVRVAGYRLVWREHVTL